MLSKIFFAIALAALIPSQSSSEEVIVKKGETLSGIANKHKVPVSKIKLINGIHDPDKVNAGDKLNIPIMNSRNPSLKEEVHKVAEGETITSIAKKYGYTKEEIIELNNFKSADYLYLGQIIKLPSRQSSSIAIKAKSYHIVKEGETLSKIAFKYKLPLDDLVTKNNLKDPNNLPAGTKLSLKNQAGATLQNNSKQPKGESDNNKWRNYGPLQIDWSSWQVMDGSHIAPTLHKNGASIYLAVNCPLKRLNATGANGAWKDWIYPADKFEHKLVNDLCHSKQS